MKRINLGGIFIVALFAVFLFAESGFTTSFDLNVVVSDREAKLRLANGCGEVFQISRVALPAKRSKLPIEGKIVSVDVNPDWYPGPRAKAKYARRKIFLPKVVPAGNCYNAMGKVRFIIRYVSKHADPNSRIHGTKDPSCLGKRVTLNCFRMANKEALQLASWLTGKSIGELTKLKGRIDITPVDFYYIK
jgi:lipoprotein-anchoring transpeptidase ErfK/SrfK